MHPASVHCNKIKLTIKNSTKHLEYYNLLELDVHTFCKGAFKKKYFRISIQKVKENQETVVRFQKQKKNLTTS